MKLTLDNINDAICHRLLEVADGQNRTVSSLVEEALIKGGLGMEGIPLDNIFADNKKGEP